jgi:hypothetical protein
MTQDVAFQIMNYASYSVILPLFVVFLRVRSDQTKEQQLLSILVLTSALIELSAYLLGTHFGIPNLFLLHLLTISELVLLTLIYGTVLGRRSQWAILLLAGIPMLINSIFVEQLQGFNVINRSGQALLMITFAILFFAQTLRNMKIKRLEKSPLFWISCGVLIYYAASLFIFIFSKDLVPFKALWFVYWGVHAIFSIILNLFYTLALWINPQQ